MTARQSLAAALLLAVVSPLQAQAAAPYRVTGLFIHLSRHADLSLMLPALVTKVVDGDTIKVQIEDPPAGISRNETVRLIGVDTPEVVDRRKAVQEYGTEASEYARSRLLGQRILLAFDASLRDVYHRLLAYVYLEDGSCFDLELVAEGYGFAYLKYPFFFMDEFRNAELAARYGKRGMWGR
jgi:micrococcal nuclease